MRHATKYTQGNEAKLFTFINKSLFFNLKEIVFACFNKNLYDKKY